MEGKEDQQQQQQQQQSKVPSRKAPAADDDEDVEITHTSHARDGEEVQQVLRTSVPDVC